MELERDNSNKDQKTATGKRNSGKKVNRTLLKDISLETFENYLVYDIYIVS